MDVERIHILVVDDVVDVAESLAELLTIWGYEASARTSGAAALECARVRCPAAVLLDLAMPRMDGFQFAKAFHLLPGCEAVPIIALSCYSTPESFLHARQAGIGHYLLKPALPERLKELLVLVTTVRAVPSILQCEKRGRVRRSFPAPPPASCGPRVSACSDSSQLLLNRGIA